MINSIYIYQKYDRILKTLKLCTEEKDNLFEKEGIQSYKEKCFLLKKCMEIIETKSTPEKITEKDEYDFDRAVFVEGSWRFID